jgi:hypothetical protein
MNTFQKWWSIIIVMALLTGCNKISSEVDVEDITKLPKTTKIAGYTILAMPLESIGLTPEQQKKFEEAGGLINPLPEDSFFPKGQDKPIQWTENFERLEATIDGTPYQGFDLFKKVYEAFPSIKSITKEEAIKAGIYPTIYYRNFAARKWMAELNGGHLAMLDSNFNGEFRDIYNEAKGKTNLEKLASIGQAPFGSRHAAGEIYYWLDYAFLGSDSLDGDGHVRTLYIHTVTMDILNGSFWQRDPINSVVVLDMLKPK